MGSFKDYILDHTNGCEYCIDIDARKDLSDMDKYYKQEAHAMDTAVGRAEAYAEGLKYNGQSN